MRNLGGLRTSRSGVRGKGASAVEVGTPNALEKLAPGREAAIGATLYEHPTPGAVWVYRQAGLNWLWLDTEHMPNDDATVRGVAEAALHFEIPLLVRVRDVRAAPLSRMLDFGASGIIVPRVESAEEALLAVRACHYPPHGCRGIGLLPRFCPDPQRPATDQMEAIRSRTVVIVQVETVGALERVDEIVSVPGLDGILFGPADMSISMGLSGQTDHPRVLEAMRKVVNACARAGIAAGYHHDEAAQVCRAAEMGFSLLSVGYDSGHLINGVRASFDLVRAAGSPGALRPGCKTTA